MSANLLDLAKGYLSKDVMNQAASFIGEDASSTESAFQHILPTLMGGMMNKAQDKNGAAELFNMVTRPEMGGGLLNNLGGLFSGSETSNSTLNLGGTLMKTLMGNRSGAIVDLISSATGIKSGSASTLLKMGLPILLSVIGKKVKTDGLGLDGFMSLLKGQEEYVAKEAPAGFMDKMLGAFGVSGLGAALASGAGNVANSTKKTVDTANTKVTDTTKRTANRTTGGNDNKNGKSGFSRLLPLLLLLGALVLAYFLFRNCNTEEVKDDVNTGVENTENAVDKARKNVAEFGNDVYKFLGGNRAEGSYDSLTNRYVYNAGNEVEVELPNGETFTVGEFSGENTLVKLASSKNYKISDDKSKGWFTLDGIYFETGSANLDASSVSRLENIAKALKAYPNVHLKLGGYTDSDGGQEVNQPLSESRAQAAMNKLVELGIDANRLAAEGYGQEHPICPANDSASCKAQNRRVDARLTAK